MIAEMFASLGVGVIFTLVIHAIFVPFIFYNLFKQARYRNQCKQVYLKIFLNCNSKKK